jgi:hypothetical protein
MAQTSSRRALSVIYRVALLLLCVLPCSATVNHSYQKCVRPEALLLRARRLRGGDASSTTTRAPNATIGDAPAFSDDDEGLADEGLADGDSKALLRSLWSRLGRTKEKKSQFMDRIALIARSLLDRENPSLVKEEHLAVYDDGFLEKVTPQSDLTRPGRYIHVVTTAALPWFTGTAVNPLLRAAYLYRRTQEINLSDNETALVGGDHDDPHKSWVILVIPWLELREDQELLYGQVFANTTAQEVYIRHWLRNEANMPDVADHLDIIFYPARYHTGLRSIFAMGDLL